MIEFDTTDIDILYCDGSWVATHDESRCDGPAVIELHGQPIATDHSFYVDDLQAEAAIMERFRAFRKAGAAVVQSGGHFPFGAESAFSQTCRYAANHVRVTADLRWKRGDRLKRHLGVGGLFLPGDWRRYFCVPPGLHLAEGVSPAWHPVPPGDPRPQMVGHWHRPPLSLTFERVDGVRVEIGTGDDLWRWERNLGFGPESGSYKIVSEPEGVRLIREPLMTCEEVVPKPRDYRFTSYLAWWSPQDEAVPDISVASPVSLTQQGEALLPDMASGSVPSLTLDLGAMPIPDTCLRVDSPADQVSGKPGGAPCWHCKPVQKNARRIIRRIASLGSVGALRISGLTPGPCWDPRHLGRPHERELLHWDMCAILDFAEWTRQQLGPDWAIAVESAGWSESAAMRGLMRENGFRTDLDDPEDAEDADA